MIILNKMQLYLMNFLSMGFTIFSFFHRIQCMAIPDTSPILLPGGLGTGMLDSRMVQMSEEEVQRYLETVPEFNKQVTILPKIGVSKDTDYIPLIGILKFSLRRSLEELKLEYPQESKVLTSQLQNLISFQQMMVDWTGKVFETTFNMKNTNKMPPGPSQPSNTNLKSSTG
ncbi:hypothetical protein PGT21_004605 [Puccinia graminis f. sp. tritici]|uniref:Uncharacterized protein n=1 Tax=Puccinia graminis f. sp. tritici TaxID=56615 RepID=A0A5B0RBW6_PUCGR|nr:hypothetical protein PGT21_004605 [Puccinia graminis f. sp. tritici]KAA1123321.1 hypothetical protein PGTUg99_006398 [Puccinia graminis f. sp. tritici]